MYINYALLHHLHTVYTHRDHLGISYASAVRKSHCLLGICSPIAQCGMVHIKPSPLLHHNSLLHVHAVMTRRSLRPTERLATRLITGLSICIGTLTGIILYDDHLQHYYKPVPSSPHCFCHYISPSIHLIVN